MTLGNEERDIRGDPPELESGDQDDDGYATLEDLAAKDLWDTLREILRRLDEIEDKIDSLTERYGSLEREIRRDTPSLGLRRLRDGFPEKRTTDAEA